MKARRSTRGASLPETAIIMTVVLALLFGIMDFGRFMYTYAFVAQLAREGARWSIVRGTKCTVLDHCNAQSSDVQTYVRSLSEGATAANSLTATLTPGSCPPGTTANISAPGCTDSVTVSYPFKFAFAPYLPSLQYTVTSTSQMVVSQ